MNTPARPNIEEIREIHSGPPSGEDVLQFLISGPVFGTWNFSLCKACLGQNDKWSRRGGNNHKQPFGPALAEAVSVNMYMR